MKTKYLCPKCGKELTKETEPGIDYPFVCLDCDENFYTFEAVVKKTDYTDEDIENIRKANLKAVPYCLTYTPEDYYKYFEGGESEIFKNPTAHDLSNEYICILHDGELDFIHYGEKGLTELKQSNKENGELHTFGRGIYCYNEVTHRIVNVNESTGVYKGHYKGKYIECMRDIDPSDKHDKGYGNSKEYMLITDNSIPVEVIK